MINELIFKFTSDSPPLASFFHRYTLLFNEYYRSRENKAYFETIDHGFLYILPDLETYKQIAISAPNAAKIQQILKANKESRARFAEELIHDMKFSPNQSILLNVEVVPYPASEVYLSMKKIYTAVHPGIDFTPIDEGHFSIRFPHLDALIDYNTVFLASIRPKESIV
jgi:hypothetical protein